MGLTYKGDGLRKELRQILAPVVRDGDLFVLEFPGVFKEIRQVRSNIQDVFNAELF